jgi:hypothetical protein
MTAKEWAPGARSSFRSHAALQITDPRRPPGLPSTPLTGSTLAAWLTRLDLLDAPMATQPLTDGLARWLGWTDAIALAAALQASPTAGTGDGMARPPHDAASIAGVEREHARVQASLVRAIEDDRETATDADFAAHRRRCLALQQAMAADVGALRTRVRTALACRSPALGRLAALDAVLGQALVQREQALLAMLPTLLERHFERLRPAAAAGGDTADGTPHPGAWLQTFRLDMKRLLRAELDLRLQPVQGLIDALRAP